MTTLRQEAAIPQQSWRVRKSRESMAFRTLDRVLRNPAGLFALIGLLLIIALAVGADFFAQHDPIAQSAKSRYLSPSFEHPFGTDSLRRDLFARTLHGLRSSLMIALLAVTIGAVLGIGIGFVAGYAGRWIDAILMRIVDALLAFPSLLAAMAILTVLGPGLRNLAIAIAFFNIPTFARLARAQMLVEKERDYVFASQSLGAGPGRIIFRHIAVNAIPPLLTQLALAMNSAIILSAALSFLGLGETPPQPSLGSLLYDAKSHLREAWWMAVFPGAVLAFLLLCLNFLADAINEATSPYSQRKL